MTMAPGSAEQTHKSQ